MPTPLATRIFSDRLVLRAPVEADVNAIRRLHLDNAEHLRPWSPAAEPGADPFSPPALARLVVAQRKSWLEDRAYTLLIEEREAPGQLAGRIALTEVVRGVFQSAVLGYWVDRRRQGQGLMTEAVAAVVRFAFDDLRLHRVQAAVVPHNLASRRVLTKTGFREEGVALRYLKIAGRWQDHVIHAITDDRG